MSYRCGFGLCLVFLLHGACSGPSLDIGERWDELDDRLGKGLTVLDRFMQAKDPGLLDKLNVFRKDKGDLAHELDKILAEVVEVLDVSELSVIKARIDEYLQESRTRRARVSELRFEAGMIGGDKGSKLLERAEEESLRLAEVERRIQASKAELQSAFERAGVRLDEAEIDALLFSITGNDDVQLFTVYDNIKLVTERLKNATQAAGESLQISRRYFGMHVLLLRTLLVLQNEYVRRIDDEYFPRLEGIITENLRLEEDAQLLLRTSSAEDRTQIESNRRAASLTLETAQLYKRYLQGNRERVEDSIRQVEAKHAVALHTYQTVAAAYDLVSLMNDSEEFFQSLNKLQVPELLVFENNEIRQKFRELTERMQRS